MDDAEESHTGGRAAVIDGPVVGPVGRRVYRIDTARGLIRDLDLDGGRIGEPHPLIAFDPS